MTEESAVAADRPSELEKDLTTLRVEGIEVPVEAPAVEGEDTGLVDPDPVNTPEQPEEVLQTECAFVVFLDSNTGKWIANGEILGKSIAVARGATMIDFTHAVADISKDILIHDTVETMIMAQTQMAGAMMQKQREAAVMQQVAEQMERDKAAAGKGGVILGQKK